MTGFRVGVEDPILVSRPTADALTRAQYLGAVANRVDSFWVTDHLNQLFPRSVWKQKYCGATKVVPKPDASMEPWTMLGHIAARNRVGRLRLGVGVTDTGRRNPAVTAQAAATLHLLTRGRAILGIGSGERESNEPYGVDWSKPVARFEEAMATIRALWGFRRRTR
jgi:phthiodiolone/phenolphthiodiolone dimycocerosates ketoreductase